MSSYSRVIVIGAGVSGLVTLKTLRQLGVDCIVYEANDYHGGLWHFNKDTYGVMEFTHINVSRHNYAFSDFPFPEAGPEFAHHSAISNYIDSYVDRFNLAENICYKTKMVQVERAGPMDHFNDGEGDIIHSVKYKDVLCSGFQEKNVVVIGIGNSSVDIADNLVTRGSCKVQISARSGAWVFPNYWFGNPAELHINRLVLSVPILLKDLVYRAVIFGASGNPKRWGLNPKHGPASTHPTISPTLIHHIQRGAVRIAADIKEIAADSVTFGDGSIADDVDVIIKCTGYTIDLPYLTEDVRTLVLNEETNDLNMFQTVFNPDIGSSLAFIGYIQPIGGLIMISEIQAQWLGMIITEKCSLPSKSEMEMKIAVDKKSQSHYTTSTRHTIQREPIVYCDEIASYFGAKPHVIDHPRLAYALLFGSGGAAQWTLQGPYYSPAAADMVRKVPIPAFNPIMFLLVGGILLLTVNIMLTQLFSSI